MTIATWTPERIEQLRTCIATGLSCSEIAAEIGVTRNAVIGKIHRLGLAPGRPTAGLTSGPAHEHAPRARRSPSPQRQFLRLICADRASPDSADAGMTNIAASASVESAQPCSLLELAACKCRWPVSNGSAADFVFCGNDAVGGFPYCAGHARMAYRIPGRARRA